MDASPPYVSEHGIQGPDVAVDVGDERNRIGHHGTNEMRPKRSGLCGLASTKPESDHWLRRRSGSIPSQRLRLIVQVVPGSGGNFGASSTKFRQGIASSMVQPLS